MSNNNTVYSFFDRIVCINLKERNDRREIAEKRFQELGIPVEFYLADRDPESGERGCYNSHMTVIKKAYHDNLNNVLIFEDDVCPTKSFSEKIITQAINFMKSNASKLNNFSVYLSWRYSFNLASLAFNAFFPAFAA